MATAFPVGKYYYVQWSEAGIIRRKSTRIAYHGLKTLPDAVKNILAAKQLLEGNIRFGIRENAAPVPLDEAINRYMAYLQQKLAMRKITSRSLENAMHRVPLLAERLKRSGISYIQDGHKANCMKFMASLSKEYAPSTCQHFAHLLSAIWNQYIKDDRDPVEMRNWWHNKDVLPEQERKERAVLSNEDWVIIEEALKTADPRVRFVCTVGHFTGARLMACADIMVGDFDAEKHTLTLPESKKRRVTVGCCNQLSQLLLDWPTCGSRFIPVTRPNVMAAEVSDFFKALRKTHPGRFAGVSHHTFRRTFITRAYALGIPKQHSMALVGHTQQATHDLYKQKVDDVLVTAAQQIADSWN